MVPGRTSHEPTAWTPPPNFNARASIESWPDDVFANPIRRRGPLVNARFVELISRSFGIFADTDDERDVAYSRLAGAARYFGVPLTSSSWRDLLPT